MKHYFDFNHSFSDTVKTFSDYQISIKANNDQLYVDRDIYMTTQNYKEMDQIKDLMTGYKQYLINENEDAVGKSIFAHDFLEGGHIKVQDAVKNLYNAMRYSIAFGSKGKDISDDFFSNDKEVSQNAMQSVKESILKVLPLTPEYFVDTMLENYKITKSKDMEVFDTAYDTWEDRKKQIQYIKENIDSTTTLSQRFKEVVSELKSSWPNSMPSTYKTNPEALVYETINLAFKVVSIPLVISGAAVKIFGGQSGEMKVIDALNNIGENFINLSDRLDAQIDKVLPKVFSKNQINDNISNMRNDNPKLQVEIKNKIS